MPRPSLLRLLSLDCWCARPSTWIKPTVAISHDIPPMNLIPPELLNLQTTNATSRSTYIMHITVRASLTMSSDVRVCVNVCVCACPYQSKVNKNGQTVRVTQCAILNRKSTNSGAAFP